MMALMSSGLNGQCFSFVGYLPAKTPERKTKIKEIEKTSRILGQTQIFIETPYRNDALFSDIISTCSTDTKLCVAINIGQEDACIKTKKISSWKKSNFSIGKRPCVFVLQG